MQGVVGFLMSVYLQIYPRNIPVKCFLNRLRFDRIMVMSLWPHFFGPPSRPGFWRSVYRSAVGPTLRMSDTIGLTLAGDQLNCAFHVPSRLPSSIRSVSHNIIYLSLYTFIPLSLSNAVWTHFSLSSTQILAFFQYKSLYQTSRCY